jgi:DNA polymerase/3'-5' exonuclease PolX
MTTGWGRIPLARAERYAEQFAQLIRDACERVQVAGTIRRRQATISDPIELVAAPTLIPQQNLFGEQLEDRNLLMEAILRLLETERLEGRVEQGHGKRKTKKWTPDGYPMRLLFRADGGMLCPVDLWITTRGRFGAVLALRTGPHGLRSSLMTPRQSISPTGRVGLLPREMRCSEHTGLVQHGTGEEVPTPEEADFFGLIGADIPEPERRR